MILTLSFFLKTVISFLLLQGYYLPQQISFRKSARVIADFISVTLPMEFRATVQLRHIVKCTENVFIFLVSHMHDACVILCITLFNKLFGLLSKLLAFLIRNNFPKRLSHEPLHYLSKFYDDVQFTFVEPPPPHLSKCIYYTPPPAQTKFGSMGITLSVRPPVCLSVRLFTLCPRP